MTKTTKAQLIDKYFSNSLSEKEKIRLDKMLRDDTEFRKEFDFEKQIRNVITDKDLLEFREKIEAALKEKKRTRRTGLFSSGNIKYAAIFLLLVGIVGTSVVFFPKRPANDKLFDRFYTSDNVSPLRTRISKDVADVNVIEATMSFFSEDYYKAIGYFENILKEDESNIAVRFYLGISYVETGNYQQAIESFRYIIGDQDNLYIEHAGWYLGLSYLKKGEIDKAINQFTIIAQNEDNYYQDKAKKILKKIKKEY
jgi:tetratricopeptide (TPR) repeat protein